MKRVSAATESAEGKYLFVDGIDSVPPFKVHGPVRPVEFDETVNVRVIDLEAAVTVMPLVPSMRPDKLVLPAIVSVRVPVPASTTRTGIERLSPVSPSLPSPSTVSVLPTAPSVRGAPA